MRHLEGIGFGPSHFHTFRIRKAGESIWGSKFGCVAMKEGHE
jgi:hypothetical protein